MKYKYEKNYTDKGYLMKYEKGLKLSPYKNWVLQFKIEMAEILPSIWRRILVPSDYNFWDLHVALQDAMGWSDYHLHHFEIKGKHKRKEEKIGIPDFDRFEDSEEVYPGWEIPVTNYFSELGMTANYLYDYGDSWWHTVKLEGYIHKEKKTKYPLCLDGARSCPPEDCGGVRGYYEMLETLSNPQSDDYEDMKQWVGEDWNAEKFDKDKIEFWDPFKRWNIAFLQR